MKKIILTFAFAFALNTVSAQGEQKEAVETTGTGFNKWSVELAGGFNKPQRPFTKGYYTASVSPFVVDFGVRYALNNKFGLKLDFGYNDFKPDSKSRDFDTQYYRANLQGVMNLGRIMNFETWTKTVGLLGHGGFGYAQLNDKNSDIQDKMGSFLAGFTAQVKLSNRIVLTGDFTTILNSSVNANFDATKEYQSRGFRSIIYNGTVGLTFYLGKNAQHSDWDYSTVNKETEEKIAALEKKVADLETLSNDSDRDGVVDYLDVEPNSIGGVMVDTKGRSVDVNNNGVPDELEKYLTQQYGDSSNSSLVATDNGMIKKLINGGYVATYFDFGKSTPTNVSTEGIDFILTYLKNNPTASVDIIGHADEIGETAQNEKLSTARANSVKNILLKAKIDPSRLNIVSEGEDTSVDKDSDGARKLVRRVTFRVK